MTPNDVGPGRDADSGRGVDVGRDAKESHYETLSMAMSEGFALCEAITDEAGELVDYLILEINPSLQSMLGVGPEAQGRRFSEGPMDRR